MESTAAEPTMELSPSPSAVAVPFLALLTVLLGLPAFAWHIKNRNLAAVCLIFWIMSANLWNFINPLIWPTDDISTWYNGVGLCDLEVKLQAAGTVGVPGALACVFRQLAIVLDTDRTTLVPSRAQRHRRIAFEMFFCFFWPIYIMVIHYVIQPNRYYIFAIAGCTPSYASSWPSIVLNFVWPVVLVLVDTYYCVLVVHRLNKYRRQFADILTSSGSTFNKSRFLRLFALSMTLILVLLPVQAYVFYRNLSYPRGPYSWSDVHPQNWSSIILMVPTQGAVTFDRWIQIGIGFLVFMFFGFGQDATLMYRSWLIKVGLGKVFPGLSHPHIPSKSSEMRSSSLSGRIGSMSSRARLIFSRKQSRSTSSTLPSRETSVVTEVVTPSPSDPNKTFSNPPPAYGPPDMDSHPSTLSWDSFHSVKLGHGTQAKTEIVESKIWSTPQISPARLPGTIKVKRELQQETEKDLEAA